MSLSLIYLAEMEKCTSEVGLENIIYGNVCSKQ